MTRRSSVNCVGFVHSLLASSDSVARTQARVSRVYCAAKQVTILRLCSTVYIVLFQTVVMRDLFSDHLSIPGPIRPCIEQSSFRSFGPSSGCVRPIVLSNGSNCCSQLGKSCRLSESSGSSAHRCFYHSFCLLEVLLT